MPPLAEITSYLDQLLRIDAVPDYPNALNGLQVDGDPEIRAVAAAVDARERTIDTAVAAGSNLLLVHHGLFWSGLQPLRGPHLRRVRSLIGGRLALYSAHLPLDAHPRFGNNVLLARRLGLTPTGGFARFREIEIGVSGEDRLPTCDLIERATRFAAGYAGIVRHTPAESDRMTARWAICTGAGASAETLREAAGRGIDTLVVGEGPHWSAIDAEELGLTVIYAGHYATETLGVQALAEHLADVFGIPSSFIDVPTGL